MDQAPFDQEDQLVDVSALPVPEEEVKTQVEGESHDHPIEVFNSQDASGGSPETGVYVPN